MPLGKLSLLLPLVGAFGVMPLALEACDTGEPPSPALGVPPAATATPAAPIDAAVSPVAAGARQLGVATDRRSPTYPSDLGRLADAGARLTTVEVAWDQVERPFDAGPDAGTDASTALFEPTLHIAGLVVPALRQKAILELDVVDDRGARTPEDLRALPLGAPAVVARFLAAQAYVLEQTRELPVAAYVIGSRLDAKPVDLGAFKALFDAAAAAARAARPGLAVGFVVSPAGLAAPDLGPLLEGADLVAVRPDTVAPLADGGLLAPDEAARVVDRVAASAGTLEGRPVHLLGLAYPAGDDGGGSPATQAAFVRATFAAWDRAALRTPVLVFGPLDPAGERALRDEARVRGF